MPTPQLIPTAEPFFYPGERVGCLLVHGFTGAPTEMHWMGAELAAKGFTVLGIRLAGHSTTISDMLRCRWWDWLASIEDGLSILKGATDQVVVMGLSMGGALSLLSAARYPMSGVIAMSAPYELQHDPRLPYLRWLHWLFPRVSKPTSGWYDPASAEGHISYAYYPSRQIIELNALLAEVRRSLPEVKVPALLMHSRHDGSVSPDNAPRIMSSLGSTDKELIWVENSGHMITREPARFVALEAATRFIRRVSSR